jgi:hypothetical protein
MVCRTAAKRRPGCSSVCSSSMSTLIRRRGLVAVIRRRHNVLMMERVILTICRLLWRIPNVEIEITKVIYGVNIASNRGWWIMAWSLYPSFGTLTKLVPTRRSSSTIFGRQAGKVLDAIFGVMIRLPRFLVVLVFLVRTFSHVPEVARSPVQAQQSSRSQKRKAHSILNALCFSCPCHQVDYQLEPRPRILLLQSCGICRLRCVHRGRGLHRA